MKKKKYEAPQTRCLEVELEQGFMNASVFDPEDKHDEGVTIDGHKFGKKGDFSNESWEEATF